MAADHRRRGAGATGWDLLKVPNLRRLWGAQTISQIADGLNKVALIWLVYTLTGSTLQATMIGVAQTIPPLLFGPVMGVYVDRFPKKLIMMSADALRAILVLTIPVLFQLKALTMPRLYLIAAAIAFGSTIFTPALEAVVPTIVDRCQLTSANALVNSTAMVGVLIGPAISGLGIATVGLEMVLYGSSVGFVLSVLALWRLELKSEKHARDARKDGVVDAFKKGLHYVLVERQTLAGFVLTALCYSLAASAFVFLLPEFSNKVLKTGPTMLGVLWSAYGAGMVVVSGTLAFIRQRKATQRLLIIIVALAAGGVASFLLALISSTISAVVLVAVVGAGLASFTPVVWSLLQEISPDRLRGRIFGIFNTGAMAASVMGMLGFGWATDALGPRTSLVGMSIILWASAGALLLLQQFGDLSPAQQTESRERAKAG